jgi:CRP-like cAMP-binding protein
MSLEQEVELIRQFPIFAKIQPAMQKLLCFSAERLTYAPAQVIFKAGDMGDAAYIVIDGKVEITVPSPAGAIVVNTLGRNDIIGEIAIFGDVPRTATAIAQSRVEALKISKELFTKIIRENPDAALELIRVLAGRLANTTAQLSRTMSGTR